MGDIFLHLTISRTASLANESIDTPATKEDAHSKAVELEEGPVTRRRARRFSHHEWNSLQFIEWTVTRDGTWMAREFYYGGHAPILAGTL